MRKQDCPNHFSVMSSIPSAVIFVRAAGISRGRYSVSSTSSFLLIVSARAASSVAPLVFSCVEPHPAVRSSSSQFFSSQAFS
jgi:hypothetical protein